uniref:Uncharacterized protein n=1 Tax=Anguilla anguilla TaxID=7936 RepID=A0A0E9QI12_ANGAN
MVFNCQHCCHFYGILKECVDICNLIKD